MHTVCMLEEKSQGALQVKERKKNIQITIRWVKRTGNQDLIPIVPPLI